MADAETAAETVAEVALEVMPEVAPEVAPEITPEAALEVVPEVAPEVAPEITLDLVHEVAPEVTAEVGAEQLAKNKLAEDGLKDRSEDRPADNETVAVVLSSGNGADSEEAGERSPETGGEVDGEKEGRQGNYGVRYVVWDRKHETKIYTIAAIQTARIHNEPHAKKLKVFASLEDAKAAASVILTRSMYEKESKGRFTYCTSKGRANLKYEIGKEVPNYFV